MAAAKKQKKVSDARAKAMAAVEAAKSDQEKRVARQALKLVKFREVAPARVSRALAALINVRKVFDRKSYSWEPAHGVKIRDALIAATKEITDAAERTDESPKSGGFVL